ncbi:UDP-glucose/GDP-mannose dehydrogenase family protein [Corynebacterium jeikeium]|uniref:UDP-glucose dehydrogenase family protein n=1 Tax=Corynebacterium jeikeium TaxID=38289 RepID=UPI0001B717ED|nr:UDP-glucose/GDP-mannose dehydrogenase family protein [Corynebacterium jeikeium]EEW16545.1 nucleotide sugar dehydrogenase [Corynebacterium jeikeium ATCC 43734]OOD29851.1 UDP-glucose 6-dehydrogenase [Corynebacterium jeikeium]WCZ52722.1 UDP-glucose 6-dehydrogenase TuaD [Corynebacterium jeikeium]SUY81972.1 UDP-glucose 6-dehydrogenase [Corynebacterium jeikeium]
MRMTVFGTGYLGATHAACMAEMGHDVLGVDVDPQKIQALSEGRVPLFEPGLPEILTRNIEAGRLRFTTDYAEAAEFADVHFIGVGTPQRKGSYAADTTYVNAVIETLAPLVSGNHTIFGKSTVPVGTAHELQQKADEIVAASPNEAQITIAWNPEFLREGHAVKDTLHPDRIVLGLGGVSTNSDDRTEQQRVEDLAREIYAPALEEGTPFLVMDLPTAELVKVSANAFLATKISFINAVSELCEIVGADVTALADAIGMDDRIGRKFLGAGLGFGGGCLPKDIRAFMARAGELGADQALTFLREVDAINMRRREKTVELARETLGGSLIGRNVTVLGAAFKPNSDDVRDSPALSVAGSLSLSGANVTVYDPQGMENAAKIFPTLTYAPNVGEALEGAEIVIVATEWKQFQELDPVVARKLVAGDNPAVLDGRNCLPRKEWEAAGWNFLALGRG